MTLPPLLKQILTSTHFCKISIQSNQNLHLRYPQALLAEMTAF